MSVFSEHLNNIIRQTGATLQYLEKESGFSTALISKIKTGQRLPDCEVKMTKLIQALHCSIELEEQLKQEYRIDKFGRESYLCMEETRRTLESISHHDLLPIKKSVSYHFENQSVIHGTQNINQMIQYLIDTQVSETTGLLRILLPLPSAFFPENYLLSAVHNSQNNLKIDHIVFLKGFDTSAANQENMCITRTMLNLASIHQQNYHSFYHYKTEIAADLFPFCVVTPKFGLIISNDFKEALFFYQQDIVDAINQRFESLMKKCHPFLALSSNLMDLMDRYNQINSKMTKGARKVTDISFCPCLLPCISLTVALSKIHPDLAKIPSFKEFMKHYFMEVQKFKITTIFSLKGLDVFMERGIFYELPKNTHIALSIAERKSVLTNFLHAMDNGMMIPILFQDERIHLSPEVLTTIYHNSDVLFMWNLDDVPFTSAYLMESGAKKNLISFASYLCENREDTYSAEDSLILVKQRIYRLLKETGM